MNVLSPRNIRTLRASLEPRATEIVEVALGRRAIDGVSDIAVPFPLKAFPDAVGLTPDLRKNLLAYGRMVFDGMGPRNAITEQVMANAERVTTWIDAQCSREALSPGGLGAQVYEAVDAGSLTEAEAALTVRSLLSAGVDTTILAIGSALLCFAQYPEQWGMLRENPAQLRLAFEEVLRFHSPFQMFFRTARHDVDLAGTQVARDDKILIMVGSANRDPRQWEAPDTFDISRRSTGHLAFGRGIHTCVGQTIARLEADVLLGELIRKVASIELDGEPIWQESNTLRGLESAPLTLESAEQGG
jgi:cytochrome P450